MVSRVAVPRRFPLLAIVVVLLAAIPPILVFSDRWFGAEWLANMWRDEWCRTRFLCDLSWPPYILVILLCAVGVLALVRFIGTEQIAPKFEVETPDPSQPVSETQRRLGVMLILASVIGVVIAIVRLALAPTVPGWDYILI